MDKVDIKSVHFLTENCKNFENSNIAVRRYFKTNNILYIIYYLVKFDKAKLPYF